MTSRSQSFAPWEIVSNLLSCPSPYKTNRGITWIRKGSGLPTGTATANFNKDEDNVWKGKRVSVNVHARTFGSMAKSTAELNEEVVGLGEYGNTLTVLWADSLPYPDEAEEREESEEATTKTFCPHSDGVSGSELPLKKSEYPYFTML